MVGPCQDIISDDELETILNSNAQQCWYYLSGGGFLPRGYAHQYEALYITLACISAALVTDMLTLFDMNIFWDRRLIIWEIPVY